MNHFSGVIGNLLLTMFCYWLHPFPTGTGSLGLPSVDVVRPIVRSGWPPGLVGRPRSIICFLPGYLLKTSYLNPKKLKLKK